MNKIKKEEEYPKIHRIKSHKKNPWIFILRKDPLVDKYRGVEDVSYHCFTYYYNDFVLRAITISNDDEIDIYNGHLFKRYNERMKLELVKPEDILVHFFKNHLNFVTKFVKMDDCNYTMDKKNMSRNWN